MIEKNLESEVRELLPFKHLHAMKTVGYQEFFDYFEGNRSFEQVVELIKRNSRRYAKRQLTWFRRDDSYHWVDASDFDEILKIATAKE
jgi:tRNA dimethylallyltransferase